MITLSDSKEPAYGKSTLMGVDQSLTGTGITIWDGKKYSYSLIETKKTKNTLAPSIDYTRRLMKIKYMVKRFIEEFNVKLIAIEGMSFGSTGRIIFDIGGLSHILRELFVEENVDFIVIPPTTLKKYWTGKGTANKGMMIDAAVNKGFIIPYEKNYGTKKMPDIKFDDNVVDSQALCEFIKDFSNGSLDSIFIDKIERSINVQF